MLDIVLKIVYICGFFVMMDVMKKMLVELGMFNMYIKIEVFGVVKLKFVFVKF